MINDETVSIFLKKPIYNKAQAMEEKNQER
jgi:hypothetical protein